MPSKKGTSSKPVVKSKLSSSPLKIPRGCHCYHFRLHFFNKINFEINLVKLTAIDFLSFMFFLFEILISSMFVFLYPLCHTFVVPKYWVKLSFFWVLVFLIQIYKLWSTHILNVPTSSDKYQNKRCCCHLKIFFYASFQLILSFRGATTILIFFHYRWVVSVLDLPINTGVCVISLSL